MVYNITGSMNGWLNVGNLTKEELVKDQLFKAPGLYYETPLTTFKCPMDVSYTIVNSGLIITSIYMITTIVLRYLSKRLAKDRPELLTYGYEGLSKDMITLINLLWTISDLGIVLLWGISLYWKLIKGV